MTRRIAIVLAVAGAAVLTTGGSAADAKNTCVLTRALQTGLLPVADDSGRQVIALPASVYRECGVPVPAGVVVYDDPQVTG